METNLEPITLTSGALAAALDIQTKTQEYTGLPLRVYVTGKECDGFVYGVAFDPAEAGDLHFSQGGVDVIVDPKSYQFIQGSKVDFVDDERGRGFVVENPNHKKFRGKFYKKKSWQEKLKAT